MVDLSPEELERIKLEELRKIEEIEKQNREKKLRLQEELQKIEAEKKNQKTPEQAGKLPDDFDKVREEIRTREMISRGYVQYEGQWVPRDEADRLSREKDDKIREEEEKIARTKQRKIEREKVTYEEFKATNILFIKFCALATYFGLTMFLLGGITVMAVTFFMRSYLSFWFPAILATSFGLVLLMVTFYLLIEAEARLMERAFFIMDGERYEFDSDQEIGDYARKAARAIARKMNSKLNTGA